MAKEKDALVAQLEEVAHLMELTGENDFKVRAFRKGADALRASDAPLEDIANGKTKIAGIGEGLKGAVREFLESGEVAARAELSAKVPPGVLELIKVPGLGPKKAMLIQKELGVNSIGELEYACRENRLAQLKGFGQAIQDKVLKAIVEMNANAGKLRLDEALEKAAAIESALKKQLGKGAEVRHVGGVGRHAEIVERLELYFTGKVDKVASAVTALDWDGGLSEAQEKPFGTQLAGLSGTLRDGVAVTLWVSEARADEATLRWLCADQAMRDEVEAKPADFADYEVSWIETEWFDAGRKPAKDAYRRTEDGAVKGVFHCHTNYSDGAATLEEMVRAAEEKGYEYIGISDHSQTAFYAQGLPPEKIREQRELIKNLQRKVSIKIFHGVESDILQDGALDYDEDILAGFDFIVGSIHSRFKMDEGAMTARVCNALKNPHITMWGHPTGRLLLGRKGYG
ncbi:MAG: PHP domain-containing protein, partial [Deltaproteobacteria bacterium]|nr:PHP domain-containing protein [Deltaproteobacteria bacterium]